MDGAAPIIDRGNIDVVQWANILLPINQYSTIVPQFPGANAFEPYGTKGIFFLTFHVFQNGKKLAEFNSHSCDENGYIEINFDEIASFLDANEYGVILTDFHHTKTIISALYLAHIHKSTGAYVAYPAINFMGEMFYPETHIKELSNTLFWPGIILDDQNQHSLVVLNPYKVSYSYQLSLYLADGNRVQTEPLKIKPFSVRYHSVEESFPSEYANALASGGQCSLCIAAQYKVVVYSMIKNKETNVITTIDHLHRYCLV